MNIEKPKKLRNEAERVRSGAARPSTSAGFAYTGERSRTIFDLILRNADSDDIPADFVSV